MQAGYPKRAGANPDSSRIKRLGIFFLRQGWDACLLQGYPRAFIPLVYTHECRCLAQGTTQCPRPGVQPGQRDPKQALVD